MPIKIAIFGSGSGSNAENIITYFKNKASVGVNLVLSNKADAFVLERAKKLEVDTCVFTRSELNETEKVISILTDYSIDFIILAGFLQKVPANITSAYPNKIVNIHPALLPKYGGKGMYGILVHEAVIANKETETGITIHYINENYDDGDIIFQAKCPVLPTDDAEDVAQKVHELEYEHYPKIIEKLITA
jgi:phosphoribosylglycinamide formyltransferase 1